jgi:hypothetical protein
LEYFGIDYPNELVERLKERPLKDSDTIDEPSRDHFSRPTAPR